MRPCTLTTGPGRGAVHMLLGRLAPGEVGCLRGGDYDGNVVVRTARVELRATLGERPVLRGSVWIRADGVTLSGLTIDGSRGPRFRPEWADAQDYPADFTETRPALIVNGAGARIELGEISNTLGICVLLGDAGGDFGIAREPVLEANRIHDCGRLGPGGEHTNHDHAVYVEAARSARILDNLVYRSRDRGIQLFPDAQGTLVERNVLDGNGEAVVFGGSDEIASSGNVVRRNVVSGSTLANDEGQRYGVDSSWGGRVGEGNVFEDNCVWQDDAKWSVQTPPIGFTVDGNRFEDPRYRDREAGDFRVRETACRHADPERAAPEQLLGG